MNAYKAHWLIVGKNNYYIRIINKQISCVINVSKWVVLDRNSWVAIIQNTVLSLLNYILRPHILPVRVKSVAEKRKPMETKFKDSQSVSKAPTLCVYNQHQL